MSHPVVQAQEGKDDELMPMVGIPGKETPVDLATGIASESNRRPGITREYSGWDVYNNEAKKVDTELVNDWRDSLNSLLLFVCTSLLQPLPRISSYKGGYFCSRPYSVHCREQETTRARFK
jgi:Family of unknown function (DUF6535)